MSSPTTNHVNVREIPPERLEWKMNWLVEGIKPEEPLVCAAALVAFAAMRPEEALGLSWGDVDLDAKTAHIRRACTHGGLKAAKVTRTVDLPREAVWALEDLLKGRNAKKRRPCAAPAANEPVVCDASGRRVGREPFSQWWRAHRGLFGMRDWTLFDLRNAGIVYAERSAEAGC